MSVVAVVSVAGCVVVIGLAVVSVVGGCVVVIISIYRNTGFQELIVGVFIVLPNQRVIVLADTTRYTPSACKCTRTIG